MGNRTNFIYDACDRLTREIDPLGRATAYEYDLVHNVTGMRDRENRRIEYEYDELDRRMRETWIGTSQVIDYTYDKASRLTSVSDNNSSLVLDYDDRDRLKTSVATLPKSVSIWLITIWVSSMRSRVIPISQAPSW